MSLAYRAVGWNRQKKIYDGVLLGGVVLYLAAYVGLNSSLHPNAPIETTLIRAFGSGAFILLHLILSIGPLCRLDSRFLPLLYNRRHLGVTMFVLALAHGLLVTMQYHAFSAMNPLVSIFVSNGDYGSLTNFPFHPLGFAALVILFLMAATSHDFWMAQLSAPIWKALHLLVYLAYGLLVAHVSLGILQAEERPTHGYALAVGLVWLAGLHLVAAFRERELDRPRGEDGGTEWVELCPPQEIANHRARIFTVAGERVAVFRYDGKVSALSNVCQHQNGPLGEGRVIKGCIVCPWHGYEYRPEDGRSPEPFTEKVPTFRLKLEKGRLWIDPQPNPAGTPVEPIHLEPMGVSS